MELFKMKQLKNNLILEGRQLTTKYVQKQERIVVLNKKLN
jgi:hypothetical protein